MDNLITIRGLVEDLDHSTHVAGVSHRTTTTHLSIFKVDSNRVVLRTTTPSVISNGDEVVLAGKNANGQFVALACKNLSANWTSPLKQQGCAFVALLCIAAVSFLLFFLVFPVILGGVCLFFAYKVKTYDNSLKRAHEMIEDA